MASGSPPSQDYLCVDGVEELERYTIGGYHPVNIGDVLHNRYQIVNKLGHGAYSTVWLARDSQREEYVALKVCVASGLPNETKILRDLSASSQCEHPGRKSIPSECRAWASSPKPGQTGPKIPGQAQACDWA
jgi:serine/threonine-protein kinase SRPK3